MQIINATTPEQFQQLLADHPRVLVDFHKDQCPGCRMLDMSLQRVASGTAGQGTTLLRRFVNLVGLYPVGTLVRLESEEVGVVTKEHPTDPFRPQVKVLLDRKGALLEQHALVNTWERDALAVVEAVDPDTVPLDPLEDL